MAIVIEDLERGHTLQFINRTTELIRSYFVSGLVTSNPSGMLLEAIDAPGIPNMGAAHPDASALFVVRKKADPAGGDKAYVEVIYSNTIGDSFNQQTPTTNDGEDVKQVSSNLLGRKQSRDVGGNPMLLTRPTSLAASNWPDYQSEADVLRPVGSVVFERSETSPPTGRVRGLVGKVNSPAIGSYGDKTLLFASFNATSTDGGRVWRTTYEFRYDPRQWVHIDSYHGPDGKVPSDADEVAFEVYEATSFAGLDLDFDDGQTPI